MVYEYSNHLVARGHQVTVVHPQHLGVYGSHPLNRACLWLRNKTKQPASPVPAPRLDWYPIDSRVTMLHVPEPTSSHVPDADAVIATFWATAEYVVRYPPQKGGKFYFLQAFEQEWAGPKTRVEAVWKAPIAKIAVSRALYEYGLTLGIPENDITYIPNGIDHTKYRVTRPIRSRNRRIAMLYHPLPNKGSIDGIKALELVHSTHHDIQAILFGTPPRPTELPNWIEYSCGLSLEELVNRIYNGSSIYICPSWTEGFGLPPAEAMACGCAIAVTDSGGVRDFADHGVTALLSPPRDPMSLAKNIIHLLEDNDLRIRLANAGHKRIQQFTWERSTDLLEDQLKQRSG